MAAHADLEIRILEVTPKGYPVEITFNGKQEFPRGYLKPDNLPWISSASARMDGERLFDWLLADDRLKTAWAEVRGQSPQRRIRLRLDAGVPELHAIPWELLCDTSPGLPPQTLAADVDTPFSRYLDSPLPPRSPVRERCIKLLVAIANPTDLPDYDLNPIEIETEQQLITKALSGFTAGRLELTFLEEPVTLSALETNLKRGYHFLHLVAHGRISEQRKEAVLFLANDDNQVELITEGDLAGLLARQEESLRLVLLAACQTATRSPSDAFRGFTPQLVAAGVPAVVAMQDSVPVDVARQFTSTFYRRLLQHGRVDLAANEGRSALLARGEDNSWAVPALYSRVPDGLIVEPKWPLLLVLALATTMLVAVLASAIIFNPFAGTTPIPTMPDSAFNVAVAQFTTLDDDTEPSIPADASQELSQWLFDAVEDETKKLPPSLRDEVWGPDQVGPVTGQDATIRDANAEQIANQINASLLIYGIITRSLDSNAYYVQPEFYITEDEVGFDYGSEVVGSNRLGRPVSFRLPLDFPTLEGTNEQLYARSQALREIIGGLADLYIDRYHEAYGQFERAAGTENWEEDAGKEVIYLLMGAAKLQAYRDPETDPDEGKQALSQALEAFTRASELNPEYARSYLGLGTISLQQASDRNPNWPDSLDTEELTQAEAWYSKSLRVSDQPASAYISVKAAFGLGQVHQLRYEYGLSKKSGDQARGFFNEVIAAYSSKQAPDLIWFAGHAYAGLGRLAGHDREWQEMSSQYSKAIDILDTLPGNPPFDSIAYFWAEVAFAREKLNRLDTACDAYRQAIENGARVVGSGEKSISPETLDKWKTEMERLEKGGAC
jgi:tetratricopeptide (TPR) repeat protein